MDIVALGADQDCEIPQALGVDQLGRTQPGDVEPDEIAQRGWSALVAR